MIEDRSTPWYRDRPLLVEGFAGLNLAFLVLDVFLAHSYNQFAHWAEWIPLAFSAAGALAVAGTFVGVGVHPWTRPAGWWTGLVTGGVSVLVGMAGLIYHLEGSFFREVTLRSLTYSAPFVAPLSFTGLGLLLILNRIEEAGSRAWAEWVLFLAWAGFVGNFGLSLLDHAQNGFFYWEEWIAVVGAAPSVGFVLAVLLGERSRSVWLGTWITLGVQVVVGLLGAALHLWANLEDPSISLWNRMVYGAPVLAPLLFPNLAVLAGLALWELQGTFGSD